MATELVPVVDLRVLSQSDLDALAAASVHAVAPRSCPDADPLPPLKIDRAVFNESAGSRKQTFSRLRLAAASSPSALPTSTSSTPLSARDDPENHLIAYHLRCLFTRDDPSLPPSSSPPPPPPSETLTLPAPSPSQPWSASPDPDRETTNSKGVSVDLVRLAGMVDPYGGELRRRTAGLMSESELMGFINGLAGQWVSQRRRRKFVDAAFFGDHLPSGWKLQLGLKREERIAWVHCHSYVSPKGNQFATCKEVSAYLMSLLGYPEAKTVTIQYDSTGQHDDGDDDCDLQLGFGGQKQHIFPGYGELRPSAAGSPQLGSMVRNNSLPTGSSQYGNTANLNSLPTGSSQFRSLARPNFVQTGSSQFGSMARPSSVPPAESSQFGSMATQNFVSAPEPTLVLGYAPQMGSGPPVQLGWDLSLSRMVTGGMLTGVCVWCNIQFHHFGTIDEQQAGSFGFICPACKDKISGQRNMPNNGSWQP